MSLRNIEELIATDNRFTDANHIAESIKHLDQLHIAQFMRCPAHLKYIYYRDTIIMKSNRLGNFVFPTNSHSFQKKLFKFSCLSRFFVAIFILFIFFLEMLDNKPVNSITRKFLKIFDEIKFKRKPKIKKGAVDIDLPFSCTNERTFSLSNIISEALVESIDFNSWINL